MSMSLRAALVAVLSAVLLVQAPGAGARSAPTVSLAAVQTNISVDVGPQFIYSTSNLPSGAVVQLQRQSGSTWTVVATVPRGQNRTVTAPVLPAPGKYPYRMQAVNGSTVVAQSPQTPTIYAYGNVSIQTLCPHTTGTRVCTKVNTSVGGTIVTTHMAIGSAAYPNYFAGANYTHSTCRSASLVFTNPHNSTSKTWLKLAQSGQTPHVGYAGHGVLGHLNAPLVAGQVFFDASTEGGPYSTYVDGTLSCWTATGTTQ
jgi:hypothetical protein